MKRTENVFEFPVNLKLENCGRGVLRIEVCGLGVSIDESIPDLIAALQQFQRTGTFVEPAQFYVAEEVTGFTVNLSSSGKCAILDSCGFGRVFRKDRADRIAAILNEGDEE